MKYVSPDGRGVKWPTNEKTFDLVQLVINSCLDCLNTSMEQITECELPGLLLLPGPQKSSSTDGLIIYSSHWGAMEKKNGCGSVIFVPTSQRVGIYISRE